MIVSIGRAYDHFIVRGDISREAFAVFYFKDDVLIAADAINSAPEFMIAKRLISAQAKVPPLRLADSESSLKEIAAQFK